MLNIDTRPALNIPFYIGTDMSAVPPDIASLSVEAKASELDIDPRRVWHFTSLPEKLSSSPEDMPASLAALEVGRLIHSTPAESQRLIFLCSPADNYPEARLDIYFAANRHGRIKFDAYGIPARENLAATENRLDVFKRCSDTPDIPRLSGSDLLMTPLAATMELQSDIHSVARQYINLPKSVWDQIESGDVDARCDELTSEMIPVAIALQSDLFTGVHPSVAGIRAEASMVRIGGRVDFAGSGCGISNKLLFSSGNSLVNSLFLPKINIQSASECVRIRCPKCGWEPSAAELENMPSSCPGVDSEGKRCNYSPS